MGIMEQRDHFSCDVHAALHVAPALAMVASQGRQFINHFQINAVPLSDILHRHFTSLLKVMKEMKKKKVVLLSQCWIQGQRRAMLLTSEHTEKCGKKYLLFFEDQILTLEQRWNSNKSLRRLPVMTLAACSVYVHDVKHDIELCFLSQHSHLYMASLLQHSLPHK